VPSPPRDYAAGLHHVWVNATGNWAYFLGERDRIRWLDLLERVAGRHDWTVVAFCQMTTHVHLILDVPDRSLPLGMQYLSREYSKRFNARHDRVGRFVQRRYSNRRIEDGSDLVGAYAYVVLNPVKEGLCPAPEDWRWSSYATTAGWTADFPFVNAEIVLAELGGRVDALRRVVSARARQLSPADMSR
jgi:REP-associated tyrosine transposase